MHKGTLLWANRIKMKGGRELNKRRLVSYGLSAFTATMLLHSMSCRNGYTRTKRTGKGGETCVKPARGPLGEGTAFQGREKRRRGRGRFRRGRPRARVGKPAPNFEALAFHQGKFKKIKLSDYRGKWVVLCFYPGDFTFV